MEAKFKVLEGGTNVNAVAGLGHVRQKVERYGDVVHCEERLRRPADLSRSIQVRVRSAHVLLIDQTMPLLRGETEIKEYAVPDDIDLQAELDVDATGGEGDGQCGDDEARNDLHAAVQREEAVQQLRRRIHEQTLQKYLSDK